MRVPLVRVQRVALLAGAVAVAAVGCAGSSGHGPATGPNTRQARFVAGADRVCTELEARLVALPKPTPDQQRQLGTPTPDPATLRAAGDQLAANDLKAFEDALQRLRALGKPPGNPVAWQQFLDAFQAWIDAFKAQIAAMRSGNVGAFQVTAKHVTDLGQNVVDPAAGTGGIKACTFF
jgi:hypothetical protein